MSDMLNDFVSGALGGIAGALVSFLGVRFNYRDLYAKTVSNNRMDWINNFREEVGLIVACLKCKKQDETYIYNAEKARAKLLTRLNQDTGRAGNEYNGVMTEVLNNINFTQNFPNHNDVADVLIDLSRKILEPEWQRVKDEAGGDR